MDAKNPRTFDSLKAAAAALKLPMRVLQAAKSRGCPAFRSNRVYESELLQWLEAHPDIAIAAESDPKGELVFEQIRKLRIANDAKEGRLVPIAWVLSCYSQCGAKLDAVRLKSEAEDPDALAAAGDDVVANRTALRAVWDRIMAALQDELARPFEEAAEKAEHGSD